MTQQVVIDEIRRLRDALKAAEAEREIILPADEVCACLHEAGKRTVRIYERCERCRALMESEYPERLAAAEAEVARLREALAERDASGVPRDPGAAESPRASVDASRSVNAPSTKEDT